MGILDQMEKILKLLEAAKDDIKEWIASNDGEYDTEDSEDLVAEIESTLHEVGY